MPTQSLPQPPPPFSCEVCSKPSYAKKAGGACASCPAFQDTHYFPNADGVNIPDVLIVGDVPTAPRVFLVGGTAAPISELAHQSFKDEGAKVLKNAVLEMQRRNPEFSLLSFRYVYGVRCAVESPNKGTIIACSTYLKEDISRIGYARRSSGNHGNLIVIACGVHALHSLGVVVKSEKDALGRVYENVTVGDTTLTVIFTRSLKSIGTAVGKYSSVLADVERAMRAAVKAEIKIQPREEIEKDYVYPKTIEDVRKLVKMVFEYTQDGVHHLDWKISVDTETNTLHPHWDGLQLVAVSLAWDEGKAATIPLWHKDTPYDPQVAYDEVCWLLRSGKPTIWFNAKYDFKVFWKKGWPLGDVGKIAWDVYLAEHALEEDKKGMYSLKYLTKQDLPHLSGYEDKLHEELEKEDTTTAVTIKPGKELKLPPQVAEAYERCYKAGVIKSAAFRSETLRKRAAKGDEFQEDLLLLAAAKDNGEFSGKAAKEDKKKKEAKGGFENIPLPELCFYAAVDADATRRIAVKQVKRLNEENTRIANWRRQVENEIKLAVPGSDLDGRRVEVRCPHPNPIRHIVQEHALPLQRELAKVEYQGVTVDRAYLEKGSIDLERTISTTTNKVYELAGEAFKIGSPKKLASFLFDSGYRHPDPELAQKIADENPKTVRFFRGKISYVPGHYTLKGQIQVNEAVLKHLVVRYKCPLSNLLMSLKKADKALNSFFKNIDTLSAMWGDGRIHPGYNITGTSTSRLSSSSGIKGVGFNNQNVPKGLIGALKDYNGNLILNDVGRPIFDGVKCKKLFVPDDASMCFGNADAKGAEVTVFAGYSGDIALNAALKDGLDPHCFFASECLNPKLVAGNLTGEARKQALAKAGIDEDHAWDYDDFIKGKDDLLSDKAYGKRLKALRDNVKRLVFGLLYGAGVKKIADIAGINLDLAQQIKTLLFAKFPTLERFINQIIWEMRMFNIVETYTGRRRRFSLGRNAPASLRSRAERQAVNFMIQETSSTIVLRVLYQIAPILERDMGGRILLTVHDSIGFQVPKKYAHQMPDLVKEYGTTRVAKEHPWLKAPYRWDVELGENYGSVMSAEQYLKSIPAALPAPELDGYTEEEIFDALRDPDEHELPPKTKAS